MESTRQQTAPRFIAVVYRTLSFVCVCLQIVTFAAVHIEARPLYPTHRRTANSAGLAKSLDVFPVYETRLHYLGEVWFAITNYGLFGTENDDRVSSKDLTALRIDYSPSFEFPAGTRNEYIYSGGLWVGGIIGSDTLVSLPVNGQSNSIIGEFAGYDSIIESSSLRGSPHYHPDAKAEQQYYTRYSDTLIIGGVDEVDGRLHRPLHIEISQTSYAWSGRFSRQFVIVECWIRNIGTQAISDLACGVFLDADVLNKVVGDQQQGTIDDISGYLNQARSLIDSVSWEPMNVAWIADNDGDPIRRTYPSTSANGVVGIRILRAPPSKRFSFNWWVGGSSRYNWGPVKADGRPPQALGGLGSPQGDRNTYYLMTNGEIDYGQLWANVDHSNAGWRPPSPTNACDFANGIDTRQVLSVGPMCEPLMPGDSVPFTFAVCGGHSFHTDPSLILHCRDPREYVGSLSFDDLAFAATWASWVYDTPGIDTDGDRYEGERRPGGPVAYYTGDLGPPPGPGQVCASYGGAPDYAGPSAPPCPQPDEDLFVESRRHEVDIRWTGHQSETTPDPLTGKVDFEGYSLYIANVNSPERYSLVSTWDKENYQRWWLWGRWRPDGDVVSGDDLRSLYGDDFDPTLYDRPSSETCFRDSIDYHGFRIERCSYFQPIGPNRSNVWYEDGVEHVNPIQHLRDSTIIENGDTLTFGVYEARLTNLNPSDNVYVSVTAFDAGDPDLKLGPMETPPGSCWDHAVPIYAAEVVEANNLKVSVYPNPYRISFPGRDGKTTSYFDLGYEAPLKRGSVEGMDEQDRRIWFINLPSDAWIRIYTLDGDLVREIRHLDPEFDRRDEARTSDYSSRAYWDLITRNTQAAVSGIYLYHIQSALGSQIGKIVIIK